MTLATSPDTAETNGKRSTSDRPASLFIAWLLAGVLLWLVSGWMYVNRTQEGRVLEVAREMIGQPLEGWLIPKLNGAVRLRKPPLAYWLSAASFSVFGVNDRAGRFPAVLSGWLMLGTLYAIARGLFNRRIALLACVFSISSFLSFRHAMLAETDIYASAFVTAGVCVLLRMRTDAARRSLLWPHLLALCMAGAILSKGPPAGYLVLFAVLLAIGDWDVTLFRRFITSGAIGTLLLLALPWFLYVVQHSTSQGQLRSDLADSAEGADHHASPIAYFPMLLRATLPWTGLWLVSLWLAAHQLWPLARAWWRKSLLSRPGSGSREDASLGLLAAWALSIFLPLCCWGNKQNHYLLPVMPPVMILMAWSLDSALRGRPRGRAVWVVFLGTFAALSFSGLAMLVAASRAHSPISRGDEASATLLTAMALIILGLWLRRAIVAALTGTLLLAAACVVLGLTWAPALAGDVHAKVIGELTRDFPDGRFVYRNTDLPALSYAMRRAIPSVNDAVLSANADPQRVVLEQQQNGAKTPVPPNGFVEMQNYVEGENRLHAYVHASSTFATTRRATS